LGGGAYGLGVMSLPKEEGEGHYHHEMIEQMSDHSNMSSMENHPADHTQ
jgi:hypothetical protein